MKKQVVSEEAEYILRLRRESQKNENENITKKVWEFIGKRPVSAFASYREMASLQIPKKKASRFGDIEDEEDYSLLQRMAFKANHL